MANSIEELENRIKNMLRVFSARNERDYFVVLEVVDQVFQFAKATHERVGQMDAHKQHRVIEDRTGYLGLKD